MKLYRGYNKDYPNWGMRDGQNHIWTTDDLDYAIMYANEFDNGGVVEFEIDENKVKYASEYNYEDILGDEFGADPIDADNYACQQIINAGYNVLGFDTSDYEVYLILDEDLIISAKEINYKQEMNEVLKNAGIQIEESWTDSYDLYDIYENYQPYNVLMEYENGEQNIWFPLIKPSEYKQALLEFMKMGELVRFPKDKVFKWLEIIMKNTCIIQSITALAGHTQWFPYDDCRNVYGELEDVESDYEIFSKFLDERGFYDWCKLPDGSDAWSDYGLQPLGNILNEYQENMTAEQVLVLVNRCLDVTHQRGDLPSAFIEGGSSSLTKISNESVERKITNEKDMNWEEFVNKIGRENEIDNSVVIIKNDTTIIIRKSGNILIKIGLNPFKKAYSDLKSFNEIYNMLIKKGYIEKPNLNESIAYAEMYDDDMVVILHNPTRKELRDHQLDDECRIIYDGNNGYYFASSEWTHEQIEQKLQANNLPYAETSGEFYYYQDNLFTTRDDWSSEEEYQEYKNDWYQSLKSMPYIANNFGNFKVEIFKGEYLSEESVDLNETPISDEDYDNLKVGNKVVYDDNNSKMIQPSKYDTVVAKDNDTITTQTKHHSGRARTNVKWNKDHFKRKFSLKESLSFEPTDEYFSIGGKEFQEEGSDVYNIMYDGINIGKLAISEYPDGIKLDGLEIYERFRKKGFGRNVVQKLKDKYKGIYVRALPSAKKFWEKQGHKAYYNKDSGTYDGDLIIEELIHSENSYYGDHTSVILKNPTLRELKEYNLMESRFICFGDIWVFFDASQWIHYQVIKRYPQYKSVDMGFYDFKKKTFYFIKSFNAEDDVSNEFYVEKKMKELKLHRWLLSQPYITQNFKNFKVEVFGDWVDSPWD